MPRHLPDGSANGFRIKRLKPKLGTVGVPTGEVFLDGARAWLAGSPGQSATGDAARDGRGLNRMMEMVNGSRFGVALMGLGIHRRSFLEGAIYAAHRRQFGSRIDQYPLVRETLVDMLVDLEANMALTYECAAASRTTPDEDEGRLLRRILVPLAKMKATRSAIGAASTALEVFGGNGYMEDWPMARQLRDAQCHTIWEGTENILCLDVRRAMRGEGAHEALLGRVERSLDEAGGHDRLAEAADAVAGGLKEAREACDHMLTASDDLQLLHARRFSFLLGEVVAAGLLLDEAGLRPHPRQRRPQGGGRHPLRPPAPRAAAGAGILDDDRTALDLFEPIVRYGSV